MSDDDNGQWLWHWLEIDAQSKSPACESAIHSEDATKKQNRGSKNERESGQYDPHRPSADFAALIHAIKKEGVAYRKEEQREDRGKQFREWVTIGLVAFTFGAICWQVHEMIRVYEPIRRQAQALQESAAANIEAAKAATQQSANSETSLIQSLRAWVAPTIAKIDGAIEVGKPVAIIISYANSGRGPALNFVDTVDLFSGTPAEEANGITLAKISAYYKGCSEAKNLKGGQVVFSSTVNSYTLTVTSKDGFVDQQVLNADKIIYLDGCFLYKSFDIIRHTYFCYFYKAKFTKPDNLNICENGQYAD